MFPTLSKLASATTTATTRKVVARTRPLPPRKSVLFASHQHLLLNSPLILFLRPGDFSAQEWRQLRAAISALPAPAPPPSTTTTAEQDADTSPLKLTVLRPGLLPALLRSESFSTHTDTTYLATTSHLSGPLAVLTAPSLHPPTLSRLLALLNTFSLSPSRNAPPVDLKAKVQPPPVERMQLLSAMIDAQSADPKRTSQVAQLPELSVLRAQIVGLLSAPGARITGVLSQRSGEVGRALEGFKVGLEQQAAEGKSVE